MGYSRDSERQNKALQSILDGGEPEKRIMVSTSEPVRDAKEKTEGERKRINEKFEATKAARMPWFCPKCDKVMNKRLDNKSFVITGTLPSLSRKQAKDLIETNSGVVSSSISKKTDFLLCGDNPGSKYQKAQKLNIEIINETQLKELINDSN